jgi:hypothetical protein
VSNETGKAEINPLLWDLRFSQRFCLGFNEFGMSRPFRLTIIDVSKCLYLHRCCLADVLDPDDERHVTPKCLSLQGHSYSFSFVFLWDIIRSKYKIYPESLLDQYFRKLLNVWTVLPWSIVTKVKTRRHTFEGQTSRVSWPLYVNKWVRNVRVKVKFREW